MLHQQKKQQALLLPSPLLSCCFVVVVGDDVQGVFVGSRFYCWHACRFQVGEEKYVVVGVVAGVLYNGSRVTVGPMAHLRRASVDEG